MILRAAHEQDTPAIEAFLARHADTSMFLRSNLAQFGASEATDHPNATRLWLGEEGGGIIGVLGLTNGGVVLPQWPGLSIAEAENWAALVSGKDVTILMGPPDQITPLRRGLGFETAPLRMNDNEELYRLPLADLQVPAGETILRAPSAEDRPFLEGWRQHYLQETFQTPQDEALETARKDLDRMIGHHRLRVLADPAGHPLSMTAFNAVLPDMVQVGAVYTPPERRGRGLARRAVALHLAEARADGVDRAILFAASAAAAKAYRAIGFQLIGHYTLCVFDSPQEIVA